METTLITISDYCLNYDIEPEFLVSLEDFGIVVFKIVDAQKYIHIEQFSELEKYIHLHYDLHINIEGIDAIRHLLNRVEDMKQEIVLLKSRLNLHE